MVEAKAFRFPQSRHSANSYSLGVVPPRQGSRRLGFDADDMRALDEETSWRDDLYPMVKIRQTNRKLSIRRPVLEVTCQSGRFLGLMTFSQISAHRRLSRAGPPLAVVADSRLRPALVVLE
jgi:hypothetical protein